VDWRDIQPARHSRTLLRHCPGDFDLTCLSPSFSHFALLSVPQVPMVVPERVMKIVGRYALEPLFLRMHPSQSRPSLLSPIVGVDGPSTYRLAGVVATYPSRIREPRVRSPALAFLFSSYTDSLRHGTSTVEANDARSAMACSTGKDAPRQLTMSLPFTVPHPPPPDLLARD